VRKFFLLLAITASILLGTQAQSSSPRTETGLTHRAVERFMTLWLATQNRHDFGGYSRMYATDFVGIKRTTSGNTKRFTRKSWLNDRRPMMAPSRHLHITAENIRTRIHNGWAEVSFDQYFRTKNYGDWGPKILWVRATKSGPQVFHEELRASHPLPDADC